MEGWKQWCKAVQDVDEFALDQDTTMHVESMCSPFIVQDQALFSRLDFSIFANLIANSPYTQQCLQELTTFSDKNIMTTIDLLSQIHSRPAQNEAILNVCTALLLICPWQWGRVSWQHFWSNHGRWTSSRIIWSYQYPFIELYPTWLWHTFTVESRHDP